jgi:hypothetical protein
MALCSEFVRLWRVYPQVLWRAKIPISLSRSLQAKQRGIFERKEFCLF